MSLWTGVILAAGQGTRMKSDLPKVLHTVCGTTLLGHVAGTMRVAGAARIVVVVSPPMAESPEILGAAGKNAIIAVQDKPLGTAHALLSARSAAGETSTLVIGAGDMALVREDSISALVTRHQHAKALISVLTAVVKDPSGLGRVIRGADGEISAIVEEAEADESQKLICEVNTGMYCVDADWAWQALQTVRVSPVGEKYLPDLISAAAASDRATSMPVSDVTEALGVNNRIQLAEVEHVLRERIRHQHMLAGVTIRDPESTYIDINVEIGRDTELLPGNHIYTGTRIGANCSIGPNSIIRDSVIGDGATVISSYIEGAEVGAGNSVGPFSRIRAGTVLEPGAYVGNFAEIKNSRVGSRTHVGHFSYVGDSELGSDVNIGAGTVTANFDGKEKHRTVIGDGVKIGSDTVIVAPVTIGNGASTGAGAVVNRDVQAGETVVGVPAKPISMRAADKQKKDGDG